MVVVDGMDTGRKPGGGMMSEKSSWLSDDAALSSLEDMSTTAGCRDVMCVRRAYVNSQHRGVASCIHLLGPCAELGEGGSLGLVSLYLLLRRE